MAENVACCFDRFPAELYREFFKYLDVSALKSCKAVCHEWDRQLYSSKFLVKRCALVYRGSKVSGWSGCVDTLGNSEQLLSENLRVKNFGAFAITLTALIFRRHAFKYVTNFELAETNIRLSFLKILLSKFENLTSFNAIDVRLCRNHVPICARAVHYALRPLLPLKTLKSLKIHVKEQWDWKQLIFFNSDHRIVTALGTHCIGLEHLTVQIHDTGLKLVDYPLRKLPNVLKEVIRIIHSNAHTLKILTLEMFNTADDPHIHLTHNSGDVYWNNDYIFEQFAKGLGKFTDWNECGLRLEKLDLRFRLIRTQNFWTGSIFLPFLKTQTALKELNISRVYMPNNAAIGDIISRVPESCRISCKGFVNVRQSLLSIQSIRYVVLSDELSISVLPLLLGGPPVNINVPMAVVKTFDLFGNLYVALTNALFWALKHGNELFLQPQIQLPGKVLSHKDFTVEMETPLVHLTQAYTYAATTSLRSIEFFAQNLSLLTKIKIQQIGVQVKDKIVFEDKDLQEIIKTSTNLKDLWFEFCNLSQISDYGVTGISPEACRRMLSLGTYDLHDQDLIGVPISGIKGLRSLKLSDVGDLVTDVSAHHAFNGMCSLTNFGLFKPNMSPEGYGKIQDLFKHNQVIRIDPRTRMLWEREKESKSKDARN